MRRQIARLISVTAAALVVIGISLAVAYVAYILRIVESLP